MCLAWLKPPSALADSEMEEKFQDMFITAGYSAAAGAAIGAAILVFHDDPKRNLHYISMGASVGFLAGTAVGGWMAFSPAFTENSAPRPSLYVEQTRQERIVLRPWINIDRLNIQGFEAAAVLARF